MAKSIDFTDFLPPDHKTDEWTSETKASYLEFVLISVANHKGSGNDNVRFVANYPSRGLTYAKLTDLQKRRLLKAYELLGDDEKTNILKAFNKPNSEYYQNVKFQNEATRYVIFSACVQTIMFLMGVGGSAILVILAFYDSMEHDTFNRLNQSSAILLFLFTFIGAFKDFDKVLHVSNQALVELAANNKWISLQTPP